MTMNCLATPTQRTGEPEAPARASVSERFRRLKWCGLATSLRMSASGLNCGKRRAYSEPARLRDQFTGRKRPKDSDRPQPEEKSGRSLSPCVEVNGDEVEAYLLEAGVLHLTAAAADAPATWACAAHH